MLYAGLVPLYPAAFCTPAGLTPVLYPVKSNQSVVAVPFVEDALDGSKYILNPDDGIYGCVVVPLLCDTKLFAKNTSAFSTLIVTISTSAVTISILVISISSPIPFINLSPGNKFSTFLK